MAPTESFERDATIMTTMFRRQEDGGALPPSTSSVSSLSSVAIGGLAAAIVVVVLSITAMVAWILVRRKRHQRTMAAMENGLPVREIEQIARPVSAARCGPAPLHSQAGWDALGSNDTVNEPDQISHPQKRKRSSASLPKRLRQSGGIHLKRFKHLSIIAESSGEESRLPTPPSPPSPYAVAAADRLMGSPKIGTAQTADVAITPQEFDVFECPLPGSPKPDVLPSFAIRSPSRYGAGIANGDGEKPKTMRSVSAGVLDTDGAVFGHTDRMIRNPKRRQRPPMHARSVSLGAPLTRPPSGPVPPLPVLSPQSLSNDECVRQGVCVSRMSSSSSFNSADSSVLVTSPILTMKAQDDNLTPLSPTVEDLVAEDDRAELKSVANGQWQAPRPAGPRPTLKTEKSRSSVRANILRYSGSSTSSVDSKTANRLSIPEIATADRISISRVSSSNSLLDPASVGRVQKITTPTRRKSQRRQSSVSSSGSPAQKRRSSVLRDISGNAQRPAYQRQMSNSSLASRTSSNGNPFQWDSAVLAKPSALKGSPNARKGHRRQNCVRISTLTPQVFGGRGSRSRSSSPAGIVMDEIMEERESGEIKREVEMERAQVERAVANERRRSRPPMPYRISSSESCLRIQTLRASLTPSSPTLSTWTSFREQLASQPSDSNLSQISPIRSNSRLSDRSSGNFIIPKFPSPSKSTASIAITVPQPDTCPMPEFSLDFNDESPTLGFHDEKHSSSPFGLQEDGRSPVSPDNEESPDEYSPVSPVDIPSSPPLPISKVKEYDPAWLPMPTVEYDPASPPMVWEEPERSSGLFLPFAMQGYDGEDSVSPKSRPNSFAMPSSGREKDDTPPLSPKTVPSSIPDLEPKEKLTSENASSIMARTRPVQRSTSSFLGANVPVLLPPQKDETDFYLPQYQTQPPPIPRRSSQRRQRSVSNARTPRPTSTRAPDLPTIPQSDSPPVLSPRNSLAKDPREVPMGPRSAPAKSVLKNAMALRRMNSEIKTHRESRESRNFVRLGREASPLLPWIGTETEGVFDIDTAAGAASNSSPNSSSDEDLQRSKGAFGVPQVDIHHETSSAMDEISFAAISKNIDGALADFDANWTATPASKMKPTTYSYGQGYTNSVISNRRSSSVWDDGEKYWSSPAGAGRPESQDSLKLPQFQRASAFVAEMMTPRKEREERTVDPRLLSTPVGGQGSIQGTPRSLYDNDGFLKG